VSDLEFYYLEYSNGVWGRTDFYEFEHLIEALLWRHEITVISEDEILAVSQNNMIAHYKRMAFSGNHCVS
jgi:hypothetical protein